MASGSSAFSKFSEDRFDPKEWINAALRNKDAQQPLDAHASTLVMKLQLFIQEVNNALEETSLQAVQSLPRVLHDVEAVRQEAQLLREQMQIVKDDIRKVEEETNQSMKHLLQLDRIKSRMQDARGALEQAGKWSMLVSDMDTVFSTQPPRLIAAKLGAMKESLEVLRDVSDYDERVALLDSYCNRLEAQLSTPLLEAFTAHSLDAARDYCDIFTNIGRSEQLQSYYIRCHKATLLQCWSAIHLQQQTEEDAEKRSMVRWLAQFYDELLSVWHAEVVWCHQVLRSPGPILCSLFSQTLSSLQPSLESCVAEAVASCSDATALSQLISLREVTLRFAKQLENSIASLFDGDLTSVQQLADTVHHPYMQYLLGYGDREKAFLVATLASVRLDVVGVMDTVRWVADSVPKLFDSSEMALQHCIAFTSAFGAQELLQALEALFKQYCSRVSSVIDTIRANAALGTSTGGAPAAAVGYDRSTSVEEDWTQLHNGVKLIEACGDLLVHAESFEERLRVVLSTRCSTALSETTSSVSTPSSSISPSFEDLSTERSQPLVTSPTCLSVYNYFRSRADRFAGFKRLTGRLQTLTSATSSSALLPQGRRQILQLNDRAHQYSYDVIMAQLQHRLSAMVGLSVWSSSEDSDEGTGASVPKFSLAPQDYIQQVTESLLSLPQELEHIGSSDMSPALLAALRAGHLPHMVDDEERGGDESAQHIPNFTDQWLGCFARGLMELFTQSVLKIPKLTAHGCRQLIADITYLCKVIDAFGVAPSEDLQHLQSLVTTPMDSFSELASSTSPQLYSRVAAMRGLK